MQNVENGVVWGVGVTQGHWQCHLSIEHIQLPIQLVSLSSYSELFVKRCLI